MEFLALIDWSIVIQIIIIDLLLGGDNALIIALACRNLHPDQRKKGIIYGTAGAIILRVVLVAFAVTLLQIPFLKLVGAILLIWIGYKLIAQQDENQHTLQGPNQLFAAIKTIIVADIVMSLDNVLAIAGAAGQVSNPSHQVGYVIFGLVVSVPIIIAGSKLVLFLIDRFPFIVTAGAGLLGWIAGGMIVTDPALIKYFGEGIANYEIIAEIIAAIIVMGSGEFVKRRHKKANAA